MRERKAEIENWQEIYERKLVSLEEAAGVVKSGDNIFIPSSYLGHMPTQIAERADELRNVTIEAQAPGPTKWIERNVTM